MKLIILRHGACEGNIERRFIGVTDVPLAPIGVEQAQRLVGKMPEIDNLYLSPLLRCRQTAEIICPLVNKTIIDELRETDFGPFEGKTHEELKDNELYNRWISEPENPTAVPEVEDIESCSLRATKALERIVEDCDKNGFQTIGIISHGGTIMAMLARHGRPERDYYGWSTGNCGGFIMELSSGDGKLFLNEILII